MKYSLWILWNKNYFKRLKYPSPNALNIKCFWHSATIIGGFGVSLNYPILNFKEMVYPKKGLDVALVTNKTDCGKQASTVPYINTYKQARKTYFTILKIQKTTIH